MDYDGFVELARERFGEEGNIQLEGASWLQEKFERHLQLATFLSEEKQNAFCNRLGLPLWPTGPDNVYITYFPDETMDTLEGFIRRGFDPSKLRFYDVLRLMHPMVGTYEDVRDSVASDPGAYYLILQSTFDRLVSLGLPLQENSDLIVVDDEDPVIAESIEEDGIHYIH